jgi:hypothetical protein
VECHTAAHAALRHRGCRSIRTAVPALARQPDFLRRQRAHHVDARHRAGPQPCAAQPLARPPRDGAVRQETLRAFLAETAASVRRVYSGPISYCATPFERVDWDHFDVIGVNFYRQQGFTTDQYLTRISRLQATGKPVAITEFGFAACQDAANPEFLGTFNAKPLSLLGMQIPGIRQFIRPRVRTVPPRDEQAQAEFLIDQLQLLDQAGADGAFVMSFSFPLAPYSEDPRHDIDATALSIVRRSPAENTARRIPVLDGNLERHSTPSPATTASKSPADVFSAAPGAPPACRLTAPVSDPRNSGSSVDRGPQEAPRRQRRRRGAPRGASVDRRRHRVDPGQVRPLDPDRDHGDDQREQRDPGRDLVSLGEAGRQSVIGHRLLQREGLGR